MYIMKRLISPHVDIYKFPITAISSITTRITGVGLTGYFLLGGLSCFDNHKFLKNKYDDLNTIQKKTINYLFIFPSVYHTYGGVRHFIWDKYPSLLTNKSVAKSSFLLFGLSFLTSFIVENPDFLKNIKQDNSLEILKDIFI